MKKLGIDNLALLVIFGLTLTKKTLEVTADGFQPAKDLFELFPSLMQVPTVYAQADEALAELKDLDKDEEGQLNDKVQAAFDIPNDKVEFFVKHGLALGFHSMTLVNEFKALDAAGSTGAPTV